MASHPLECSTYSLVLISTMGLALQHQDSTVLTRAMEYNFTTCTLDDLAGGVHHIIVGRKELDYCSAGKYYNYTSLLLTPYSGCKFCPKGTFQEKRNVCPRCKQCRVCAENETEVNPCLPKMDRVCEVYTSSTVSAQPNTTWYQEKTSTTWYEENGTLPAGSHTKDTVTPYANANATEGNFTPETSLSKSDCDSTGYLVALAISILLNVTSIICLLCYKYRRFFRFCEQHCPGTTPKSGYDEISMQVEAQRDTGGNEAGGGQGDDGIPMRVMNGAPQDTGGNEAGGGQGDDETEIGAQRGAMRLKYDDPNSNFTKDQNNPDEIPEEQIPLATPEAESSF